MPARFTQRILDHLAHAHYKPSMVKAIARDMRIDPEDREDFEAAIEQLQSQKRLSVGQDQLVRLPSYGQGDMEVTGKFKLNAKGFGFVIPDQPLREGDLFVPPGNTGGAISGDRVRVRVFKGGRGREPSGRSGFTGKVIEVLERGQSKFVGTLQKDERHWFVEPDGRALHDPVLIRDPHSKTPGKAKPGDKVVFEIVHYPEGDYFAEGVITQVLGEAGRPDVETQAVITAHDLLTEFPEEALEQARNAAKSFERESSGPWPNREDLTQRFVFTIDPPDAKDFDDAISIDYNPASDEWTLGVHIADVSHFIPVDGALDEEAKARGNSVYLPRLVIPMLPEVLSNGVCSLQEGVTRFTKSAFMTFDGEGHVVGQRLSSTVIRSSKRLTYLEAQALIDGDLRRAREHARTEPDYPQELVQTLQQADKLAKILEKRRFRDGMIVLNLPEVDLVFDDHGHVVDAQPEDDAFTHKIIEMFMVEANEALARTFEELGIPILRRIHPEPTHGDMSELRQFALASQVSIPDQPTRKELQQVLEATRDTPAARAIHFAILRTLSKASYSPALVGHFALASDHYAHFTSPIRRYPDLSLHRVMQAYLDATENGRTVPGGKKRRAIGRKIASDSRVLDEGELIELGRHCSETEVEAEQAERELREFLVLQLLQEKHLGDEFSGVVTGMMGGGVFVSIDRFLIEGRIRTQELPGSGGKPDRWVINDAVGRATASRSGAVLAVGDTVSVQIVQIDLAARQMDLLITKLPERDARTGVQNPKGTREQRNFDPRGTRRGKAIGADRKKQKKHRKGFKQGRRGRKGG